MIERFRRWRWYPLLWHLRRVHEERRKLKLHERELEEALKQIRDRLSLVVVGDKPMAHKDQQDILAIGEILAAALSTNTGERE